VKPFGGSGRSRFHAPPLSDPLLFYATLLPCPTGIAI
jgi:hypothetical protein